MSKIKMLITLMLVTNNSSDNIVHYFEMTIDEEQDYAKKALLLLTMQLNTDVTWNDHLDCVYESVVDNVLFCKEYFSVSLANSDKEHEMMLMYKYDHENNKMIVE